MTSDNVYIATPLGIDLESSPMIRRDEGGIEACIGYFLELAVFTPKGAFDADPDFGFEYWNHEGVNINLREFNNSYLSFNDSSELMNEITRTQCEESLRCSIMTYEPRLKEPQVKIELNINTLSRTNKLQSKFEMRIHVGGFIDDDMGIGKQFQKTISFLVEPLARKSVAIQ